MITPDDFVTQWQDDTLARLDPKVASDWGGYELIHFDPEVVNSLAIPDEAKHFLIEAGLPAHACYDFRFDLPPNKIPALPEVVSLDQPENYRRYRLIGLEAIDDEDRLYAIEFVCVDELDQGRVVQIRNEDGYPIYFLNSGVPQLAEYLLVLRQFTEWHIQNESETEEERENYISKTIAESKEIGRLLRQIDPKDSSQNKCIKIVSVC